MTIPIERLRSLIYARDFLRDLLDPRKTPRVPKAVRKEAYWRLRHYPAAYEIEQLRQQCPDILGDDPYKEPEVYVQNKKTSRKKIRVQKS